MSGTELDTGDTGWEKKVSVPYTFHSKCVEIANNYVAFQGVRNAMKNKSRCYNSTWLRGLRIPLFFNFLWTQRQILRETSRGKLSFSISRYVCSAIVARTETGGEGSQVDTVLFQCNLPLWHHYRFPSLPGPSLPDNSLHPQLPSILPAMPKLTASPYHYCRESWATVYFLSSRSGSMPQLANLIN